MKKGEVLLKEGELNGTIYYIKKGAFNLTNQDKVVATLGPRSPLGRVMGEISVLFNKRMGATAVAAEDSQVFEYKDVTAAASQYALMQMQEHALDFLSRQVALDFLRENELFKQTSTALIETMAAGCEHIYFQPGEIILDQGEEKMAIYMVQEGQLEVQRDDKVELCGPGTVVGEVCLCPCNGIVFKHEATLKAAKATTVLLLDRGSFANVLSQFPADRDVVMRHLRAQGSMGRGGAPTPVEPCCE